MDGGGITREDLLIKTMKSFKQTTTSTDIKSVEMIEMGKKKNYQTSSSSSSSSSSSFIKNPLKNIIQIKKNNQKTNEIRVQTFTGKMLMVNISFFLSFVFCLLSSFVYFTIVLYFTLFEIYIYIYMNYFLFFY